MSHKTKSPRICPGAYRTPLHKRTLVDAAIDEMLAEKVIRPSISPWSSVVVLLPKPYGSTRFCVDSRKLNTVIVKDQYPLPLIQDIYDKIGGISIFSSLDLLKAY